MAEREVRGLDREAARAEALGASGVESRGRARLHRVAGELLGMSAFKKKLLSTFLFVAAVGGVLCLPELFDKGTKPTPPAAEARSIEAGAADAGRRGFVGDAPPASARDADDTPAAEPEPTTSPWKSRLGYWMARLGLSFAAGLILGIFFRSFIKTMAAITALVATTLVALSYFQVLNVDFTLMKENYGTFSGWLNSQAWHLKDSIGGVLPSTVATACGFFFGFRRK